jgi:hypothetical protein
VAGLSALTPLPFLFLCELSFPIVSLEMFFLPTLVLKSKRIHISFREFIKLTFHFKTEAVLQIVSFILCWGMNSQYNNMKPATSQYYVLHPITNKLNGQLVM